ncbi:MAG TPA: peptidoglycan editing factor PgeF [Tepidisphaeraceae bacterium]|nr:peptidoglycan editing factor PgeF [Tepidisphaeraceae bacterium]
MLQRQTESGVTFYFSPLLRARGVAHAFSTRLGGLSPAPFDSLNLGNPNGCEIQDDYERIWENYRLLHRAAGCAADEKPCRVHQVHGAGVVRVRGGQAFDTHAKADAIVGDDPTRVLSVRVADCVPILLADETGRTVAAAHAGWRGVVAGVINVALREMSNGAGVAGFVAAIGPCIGPDAFEVGPEVLEEFARVFGARAPCRRRADGKGDVDLRQAVRLQLLAAGIPDSQIDSTDRCTFRDRDEFFSHRRDNGVTGRMAAVIQSGRARDPKKEGNHE